MTAAIERHRAKPFETDVHTFNALFATHVKPIFISEALSNFRFNAIWQPLTFTGFY